MFYLQRVQFSHRSLDIITCVSTIFVVVRWNQQYLESGPNTLLIMKISQSSNVRKESRFKIVHMKLKKRDYVVRTLCVNCLLRPDRCSINFTVYIFGLFLLQLSCQPSFSVIHLQPSTSFKPASYFCTSLFTSQKDLNKGLSFLFTITQRFLPSVSFRIGQE